MHQLDVARIERLEQHEQPERAARSSMSAAIASRGSMRRMSEHTARARDARLEHLIGIDEEVLAHRRHRERRQRLRGLLRCASEPSKRLGSVSTETAAAPARA